MQNKTLDMEILENGDTVLKYTYPTPTIVMKPRKLQRDRIENHSLMQERTIEIDRTKGTLIESTSDPSRWKNRERVKITRISHLIVSLNQAEIYMNQGLANVLVNKIGLYFGNEASGREIYKIVDRFLKNISN